MGNKLCCQGHPDPDGSEKDAFVSHLNSEGINLCDKIKERIKELKPFQDEMPKNMRMVKFGDETFQGDLNEDNKPHGYGRLYKADGCLFVGSFKQGSVRQHQNGYYFMTDGSYYYGEFKDDKAHDKEGKFIADGYEYIGGFKNNQYHGKGAQKHYNYTFEGQYKHNKRAKGTLIWYNNGQELKYTGQFNDDEEFQGKGELVQEFGTYHGHFKNGRKHGKGQYKYKNSVRFEGQYNNGVKEGKGKAYTGEDKLSYDGQWKFGLPHGKGTAYKENGDKQKGQYFQGANIDHLPPELLKQRRQELEAREE